MIENQNAEQTPEAAEEQLEIQVTDDWLSPGDKLAVTMSLKPTLSRFRSASTSSMRRPERSSSEPSSLSRLLSVEEAGSPSSIVNIHSSSRTRFC